MLDDVFKDSPTGKEEGSGGSPEAKSRRFPLFLIVPGLFFLLLALIVYLFGQISFDPRTPLGLIQEVRTSRGEKRVLAAFELSRLEKYDLSAAEESRFIALVVQTYEQEMGGDPSVRRPLALTLGRVGNRAAIPCLLGSLGDADVETQLYSAWALGAIGDPEATEPLLPLLHHEDSGVRKTAAFALGQIGDARASGPLQLSLVDETPDVTWNAAVALARLGDETGLPILLPLLHRQEMTTHLEMDPRRQEELLITIIRALRELPGEKGRAALTQVAEEDPSARIRSEARMALEGRRAIFPLAPPNR